MRQPPAQSIADVNSPVTRTSDAAAPAVSAAIADVQRLGLEDPQAQQALLEQMKQTDPSLWPQLVQVFRTSMAYHQQSQARLAAARGEYGQPASVPPQLYQQVAYSEPATAAGPQLVAPGAQMLPASQSTVTSYISEAQDAPADYPSTNLPPVRLAAAARLANDGSTIKEAAAPSSTAEWNASLAAAIRNLELKNEQSPLSSADQLRLRLLYLAAGKPDDAAKAMSAPPDGGTEFWRKELSALATLLDDQTIADSARRSEVAGQQFHAAAAALAENAPLRLKNLAFCTEVNSFGIYKTFPVSKFKPGQEALLYAEVENYTSVESERGFHTALYGSFQILDKSGTRIADQNFTPTEEYCRNQRRDFFVRYYMNIPKTLAPGEYTLRLTIEDTLAKKAGQADLQFAVE